MKYLLAFALFLQGDWNNRSIPMPAIAINNNPVSGAVELERPPSHPCNLSPRADFNGMALTVCITGNEKYWTCEDKKRVLLSSEDNQHYCLDISALEHKPVFVLARN